MPVTTILARGPHARPVGSRPTAAETDWRHAAACRDANPELFFPLSDDGELSAADAAQIAAAKKVCRRCPVRRECLTDARNRNDYGIFGGLTAAERRELKAVTA